MMSDVVARPDFPTEEVERKREQRLTDLSRAKDEATNHRVQRLPRAGIRRPIIRMADSPPWKPRLLSRVIKWSDVSLLVLPAQRLHAGPGR